MQSPLASIVLAALLLCLPGLVSCQQTRTLTVTNQCPEQFWFHLTVGAIQDSPVCGSNSDCPSGTSCSGSACFYDLPSVSSGEWSVPGGGGSNTLSFGYYSNNQPFQFSGNMEFCQAGTCGDFPASDTPANCNAAPGCSVYAGTSNATHTNASSFMMRRPSPHSPLPPLLSPALCTPGPSNQAEWTWLVQGPDAYDVSNIAGVSVPMSFGPVGVSVSDSNFYSCGTPGATDGPFPSSWSFSPPSAYYGATTQRTASAASTR